MLLCDVRGDVTRSKNLYIKRMDLDDGHTHWDHQWSSLFIPLNQVGDIGEKDILKMISQVMFLSIIFPVCINLSLQSNIKKGLQFQPIFLFLERLWKFCYGNMAYGNYVIIERIMEYFDEEIICKFLELLLFNYLRKYFI